MNKAKNNTQILDKKENKTMFNFNPVHSIVKQYPYRSARVEGNRIKIGLQSNEARIFISKLAEEAGAIEDNHVVYEIKSAIDETVAPLYVWVTDCNMFIGTKLVKENW